MGQLGKLGLRFQIREEVPFSAAAIGTDAGWGQEGAAENWPINELGKPRDGAPIRETSELKGEELLRE